jgi:thiamine-monophosphate kinase
LSRRRISKIAKTLKDLGEAGIIAFIRKEAFSALPSTVKKGIGDDCAVLETAKDDTVLVTTDTLIEGIHFTSQTLSAEDLGWKSLAVNISDIAAMGGTPTAAFFSIGMAQDAEVSFLEAFLCGFNALAEQTAVALAGGDTVESPSSMVITITLLGHCPKDRPVYRSGAQKGDDIWVSGPLGNAAAGLFLLLNKAPSDHAGHETLIKAHQKPKPRLEMGKALGQRGLANAMIDISDGIAKDLGHICQESNTGAIIEGPSIPMSKQMMGLAAQEGKDPMVWALHGGEDYELLFTASTQQRKDVEAITETTQGFPATRIGTITKGDGVKIETNGGIEELLTGGYRHFS